MTRAKIFLKDLRVGWEGEAGALVLSRTQARSNRGGAYLSLELGDRSGRLAAKVWDNAEDLAEIMAEGSAVRFRGRLESYRGAPQLVIREAWSLNAAELDWRDYLKTADRPEAEMKADILRLAAAIEDTDFRRLTEAALAAPEVADKFFLLPAAKHLHHAHLHGLLEHSLSVGRLAVLAAAHYGGRLNAGLLTAGALLHDLGKVWEFSPPPRVDYTTLGRLQGHAALGARFLRALADGWPGFPGEKMDLLEHLLLSHHGEPEFGAAVRPQILEALVLHHLDNLDAKVEAVDAFLNEGTDGEGWSPYHRTLAGYFRRTPALDPGAPPLGEGKRSAPAAGRASAVRPQVPPADDQDGRLF
ncbi:MAG: HD domain-containing protein [Candidatus Adiutrix sp.]|nr:HD domain-containing protein [Candidatus Adiutrix sp.]